MLLTAIAGSVLLQKISYEFVFFADKDLSSVNVAGTFNGWNKDANRLTEDSDHRTWRTKVSLEPGKHQYKFVLNGSDWVTDPKAARNEDDGNGNVNSVLVILPADYAGPASLGDGKIAASALRHSSKVPDLNWDRGYLTLTLRARPGDIQSVNVRFGRQVMPMTVTASDDLYCRYVVRIPWERKSEAKYSFELIDGSVPKVFGPKGLTAASVPNFYSLSPTSYKPFVVPSWVESAVLYQIFPDRFANGDIRNDPKGVVAWNAKPEWFNRFGGDIAGVRQHLGYLRSLGVTGVYFNPIFKSPSNHRYDAADYHQIDPEFGTNEEFGSLTRELSKNGMRTVIDGVFNHTATTFGPFADIVKNGERSAYKNWYFIKSYPVVTKDPPNYVAWFGFAAMPKLNLANPATKSYMLGLVDYWNKRAQISGWRLDVANEVPSWFWQDFRKTVKKANPETWIVGEIWGDGTPWLSGDQFDSVMNYQFRDAVLSFVGEGKSKSSQFLNRLMQIYLSYAPQVSRNMMNLLGSHDTPRVLHLCKGDRELARLAATIQFTWVGAPSIYYGDEIGMDGDRDPDNRRGMNWSEANDGNPTLRYYRKLIAIRKSNPVLQSGDPIVLASNDVDETGAFGRYLGTKSAIVAYNRSNESRRIIIEPQSKGLPKSGGYVDALSDARYASKRFSVVMRPKSAAILLSAPVGGSK